VRPGRDADPSPPSNTEVKNRVILLLSLRVFVVYERVKPTYILSKKKNAVYYRQSGSEGR
jgi:hypothetical protein